VLFMVVERFTGEGAKPVYERVRREGRMLPEGLRYVDSWVRPTWAAAFSSWSARRSRRSRSG
jgi:hypothetical protein